MPFTIWTHEALPVSKLRFDKDFNTVTFLMKTDLYIQDWAENPPSRTGCCFTSKQSILSTQILHFVWSFFFIKCDEELSFFKLSSNQRRSTVWIISGLQEVVRNYVHTLAASFPAALRRCEDQQQEFPLEFPLFPNIRLHQVSLQLWNLWTVLCANLLLLPWHGADLQK